MGTEIMTRKLALGDCVLGRFVGGGDDPHKDGAGPNCWSLWTLVEYDGFDCGVGHDYHIAFNARVVCDDEPEPLDPVEPEQLFYLVTSDLRDSLIMAARHMPTRAAWNRFAERIIEQLHLEQLDPFPILPKAED